MTRTQKHFMENLSRLFKASGWTYQILADKVGSYPPNVSEWLSGKRLPNIETLEKIADAFDTTASALLADPKNPATPPIVYEFGVKEALLVLQRAYKDYAEGNRNSPLLKDYADQIGKKKPPAK